MLGATCLSYEERSWLQFVFKNYASRPDHWSESDLTSFLLLSFPEPLAQLVREAGPLLYRLFLCVGSYPYHQDPVNELDLGTLRTAIILLLGNDERNFLFNEDEDEEDGRAQQIRARYIRLLFQSLATATNSNTGESSARNDEDLKEALHIVSQRRILRHPIEPKIGTPAPELPSPASLPPSHAGMLNGRLKQADLRLLIRLFLACQLYWAGTDPEQIILSASDGVEKTINAILGAFRLDQDGFCVWGSFHRVMANLIPGIQTAMARILRSFVENPPSVNEDNFAALSVDEASKLIYANYLNAESNLRFPGMILDPPLLCHLAMFLPKDLPLDELKLISLMNGETNMVQTIKTHVGNSSLSSLLLISGHVEPSALSCAIAPQIVCGAFLPSSELPSTSGSANSAIFQCQPKHRVWPGALDRKTSSSRDELVINNVGLRVEGDMGANTELKLDFRLGEGSLAFSTDNVSNTKNKISFRPDIIEFYDVPSGFD